jgi:hypothetical protein
MQAGVALGAWDKDTDKTVFIGNFSLAKFSAMLQFDPISVPYSEVRVLQGLASAGVVATCTDTRADPPGLPSLVGLE